LKYPTE